jgi:hypothetical protein
MARGWESKSVEDQQAEASAEKKQNKPHLAPEEIKRQQEILGLELSKRHVEEQLSSAKNVQHREMLRHALADLEHKLSLLAK